MYSSICSGMTPRVEVWIQRTRDRHCFDRFAKLLLAGLVVPVSYKSHPAEDKGQCRPRHAGLDFNGHIRMPAV